MVVSRSYLLDTHTLLWALSEPSNLGERTHAVLRDPSTDVAMSVANMWEISIKAHLGKLQLPPDFFAEVPRRRREMGLGLIDIEEPHAILAGGLHWGHRDPFDRVLAAQACIEKRTLLSRDTHFTDDAISSIVAALW